MNRRTTWLFLVFVIMIVLAGWLAGAQAASPQAVQAEVWVQQEAGLTLRLRSDGGYAFTGPGLSSTGRYQVQGNRIAFQDSANGTVTVYTMVPAGGGAVTLVDAQGNRMTYHLQGTPAGERDAGAPASGAPHARPAARASAPPPRSRGYLLWFLASLPNLQPDQVYEAYFGGLTDSERLMVSIMEGLNSYIFQMMCTGSHAAELRYNGATGAGEGCAQLLAEAQQAAAWGGGGTEYAERQRQELMINEKCKLGLIDSASCGAYRNTQRQIARNSARTGQTIVDNMAPPPCTEYYTPDGQFVGCW